MYSYNFNSDTDNSNQNSDFNIECGYIEGVATIQKYIEDQIADPSFEIDEDNLDLVIDISDSSPEMQKCEIPQFTWIESIKGFVFGRYSLYNRNKECINDELSDVSVASNKFIHKVVPPKEDLEDKI
jgi:hypothetical protein